MVEDLGADVNAVDHEGNTAMHNAAARGDVEMILYLVSNGADPTPDYPRSARMVSVGHRSGQPTKATGARPIVVTNPLFVNWLVAAWRHEHAAPWLGQFVNVKGD